MRLINRHPMMPIPKRATMASLELSAITKSFGRVSVLKGIDLAIKDGEFLVLLGPSGCGKSTLLRLVAGLEDADSGSIAVDGKRVNELEPIERGVAMVFQNYALYPHMNVGENMGFALRMAKTPSAQIKTRVAAAAKILGLNELLERLPKELSGGQRQRVAMGRALVRETQLFLFDEPLSNLDAKLRVQMRVEIRALHARLGVTSIYVTHDQIEAMTLADRVVVMRDGQIEQIGTPFEVYDAPVNTFVAQFLGSPAMNLLPGSLRGHAVDLGSDIHVDLTQHASTGDGVARDVLFGIRPQDLAPGASGIPCKVIAVEPTGPETLLHCVFGLAEERICAAVTERVGIRVGDLLQLMPNVDRACLFDAANGSKL